MNFNRQNTHIRPILVLADLQPTPELPLSTFARRHSERASGHNAVPVRIVILCPWALMRLSYDKPRPAGQGARDWPAPLTSLSLICYELVSPSVPQSR